MNDTRPMNAFISKGLAWAGALVLMLAASAQGRQPEGTTEEELGGKYRLAIAPAEAKKRIEQRIDDGTDDMPGLRRRIGRKRLREKNPVVHRLHIAFPDDRVAVAMDEDRYVTPGDGKLVEVRLSDGEVVRVAQKVVGTKLMQRFIGDDGQRTDVFTLSEEGDRLTMRVTLTSDRLSQPIRYAIPYRRAD
ncbi:MAG: hypothetical protein ACOCV4_08150 [Myxococcota bacterium]